jgi:hypothetical protein
MFWDKNDNLALCGADRSATIAGSAETVDTGLFTVKTAKS